MDLMAEFDDNYFDLAIVDPPYGIGNILATNSRKIYKKISWNDEIPPPEYFEELMRVSKNQIIFGINYFTDFVKSTGRIVHDKTGLGKKPHFNEMSDADLASHSFGNNIKIFHYLWQGNAQGHSINWKNEGINGRIHPTQKPVQLYSWLLKKYAKKDDVILDTHLGSGSIAIACHYAGIDLVACEIDKDYYNDAMMRIVHQTKQTLLDI